MVGSKTGNQILNVNHTWRNFNLIIPWLANLFLCLGRGLAMLLIGALEKDWVYIEKNTWPLQWYNCGWLVKTWVWMMVVEGERVRWCSHTGTSLWRHRTVQGTGTGYQMCGKSSTSMDGAAEGGVSAPSCQLAFISYWML